MRAPRALSLAVTASGLALLLAACSTGEGVDAEGLDEAPEPSASADGAGGAAGEGVLVAALANTPDQFDPHVTTSQASFQVLENVYDTLVVPSAEDLTFEPSLAESWTTSEDGLQWVFTLREGVTFHDGTPLDAEDVVYSFRRIIDEELSNAFRFATVTAVEATGPLEVTMTLSAETPNLLANVGGFKGMAVVPSESAGLDLATQAVGTGPFELVSTSAGGAELTAYDGYWGEAPQVQGVEYRYVAESAAALTGLENGDVHWTDNVPAQSIEDLADTEGIELGRTGSTDYYYAAFNQTRPPFDDPDVRRAVALAVDREAVAEAATFGAGTVNQTAVPEGSFWASGYAPFETDAAEAEQLLVDAGAADLEFALMVPDSDEPAVAAAQVMASQLAEVGVTMTVDTVETGIFLDRQGQGDFDAFSWAWIGNIDPFDYYHAQHITDGSFNFQGYSNPEVDDLLTRAAAETDEDARKDLYAQAEQLVVDDVSYLFLFNPDVVEAWSSSVTGYEARPDSAVNFETVSLDG
ncbi:ABC transporter substrate-binding protein [Aquipuribacter hungaricus]|uniref:ABC transporter substrate-binding protein n=1 Tax=Aquipuribacter hungaricus TaxID=545624 RepID=A0ABV7WBC7_9MICO